MIEANSDDKKFFVEKFMRRFAGKNSKESQDTNCDLSQ